MAISPLMKFAIEAFEHAIKQYMEGSDKFSVLYCDQAIELILKEKMRAIGESIFDKHGRTVEFHDAINLLTNNKGVKIPEKADLEVIHDQRNVIQHRGATISKDEAEFYLQQGYDFIKRFLKDELNTDLKTLLASRYYEIFEPQFKKIEVEEKIKVKDAVEIKEMQVAEIVSGVLMEYRNLEIELYAATKRLGLIPHKEHSSPSEVARLLASKNILTKPDVLDFDYVRIIRNRAAHTDETITMQEVRDFALKVIKLRNILKAVKR